MKKLLIVKPRVEEMKDKKGNVSGFTYHYPKNYDAQHANHVCFNYKNAKKLKGGAPAEGMLIYDAHEEEIEALLKEDGVEEIAHGKANKIGNKWILKVATDRGGRKIDIVFDINKFIKKNEVN